MQKKSLYEKLGVNKGATAADIKKAFRKLALEHHPDKGGDPEEFKKIQKAYEVLSDDQRRGLYDATGQEDEDAADHNGGPGPGGGMPFPFPFDLGGLFGMGGGGGPGFFGIPGMGPRPQQQRRKGKGAPKVHEIPITIRDFYHGKTIKLQFERQKFCDGCKGEGAEAFESCKACGGSGATEQRIMLGPGMMSVMRGPCGACQGVGKTVSKQCSACQGSKFRKEKKVLEVVIKPGMLPGEIIEFPGECSDEAEYEHAGDVHIVLQQADEENRFMRGGGLNGIGREDMVVHTTVSLQEVLLGCEQRFEGHPGYSEGLVVEIPVGIQNKERFCMKGYGFPRRMAGTQSAEEKGDLYVYVEVRPTDTEKELLIAKAEEIRGIFRAS